MIFPRNGYPAWIVATCVNWQNIFHIIHTIPINASFINKLLMFIFYTNHIGAYFFEPALYEKKGLS